MRKIIGLLLVSTLALTACGEKEKPKKKKIKSLIHKNIKIANQKSNKKK
ncbi:putative liporotein [Staphylococcus aureus]|nr:putative liporotein [Staphylococcus aureus]